MWTSKIDENGLYLEPVKFEGEDMPDNLIIEPVPQGFQHPKWDDGKWVEGLSVEEIEARKNTPQESSEIEQLKQENEMNALAIMELAEIIMNGGI